MVPKGKAGREPKGDYDAIMRAARKRVEAMDAMDGGSEADRLPLDMALRTVMVAINSAILSGDWGTVGDAQVMLQQIEHKYRSADVRGAGFYLAESGHPDARH